MCAHISIVCIHFQARLLINCHSSPLGLQPSINFIKYCLPAHFMLSFESSTRNILFTCLFTLVFLHSTRVTFLRVFVESINNTQKVNLWDLEIFTQLLWKYVNNQHEDSLQTTKTVQIHLLFALCVEMDPLSLISTRRFQFGVIKGSLCLTFGSKDFLSSDLDGADTLWLVFISSSLFFPLQGHRKSRRAEQHLTCNTRPCLHGPGNPRYAPTKAATAGTGESRCAGRDRKGSQHGHRRVSTPVPQPTVELLNEKLPTGQKSLRQDRRSR